MNRKIWLIIFLLCSLILLVGGMHRPAAAAKNDDPVVREAKSAISQNGNGKQEEWEKAAREKPLWILQIEAVNDGE